MVLKRTMKIENHKNPKNIYQTYQTENERKVNFFSIFSKIESSHKQLNTTLQFDQN